MTAVDPLAIDALIDSARPHCDALDDDTSRCPDPAAWIVTFTSPLTSNRVVIFHCIDHMACLNRHLAACLEHDAQWRIEAVEL